MNRLSLEIVKRHWLVYRKDLIANSSPTLADPLFIIFSFGLGLSDFVAPIEGRTYLQFIAPGLAGITALMTSFFETSYGGYFRLNFEGVYKAMLTTPIRPWDIVMGEFMWVALKGAVVAALVAVVLLFFGLTNPLSVLVSALMGAILGLCFGAMGTLAMTYVRNINQFQTVYAFLIAPIYFLSGIFFPPDPQATPIFYALVQISPLYHGARIMQESAWNTIDLRDVLHHGGALILIAAPLVFWASRRFHQRLWS